MKGDGAMSKTQDKIDYLIGILHDPDLPRFYSEENIVDMERELEELKAEPSKG